MFDHRRNALLRSLPAADYALVEPHLTGAGMTHRDLLCEVDDPIEHVLFIQSGVVSMLTVLESGAVVESSTLGRENALGLGGAWLKAPSATRDICQVDGEVSRLRAVVFRDLCERSTALRNLVARQLQGLTVVMAQSIACLAYHPMESRLARWLLTSADQAGEDAFPITQEFLGAMLGVQRPTVSLSAGGLQDRGLVRISRGRVEILDREGLRRNACECYDAVRARLTALDRAAGG